MRKVPNPKTKPSKVLFFAFIGHFLELYDYTAYVVMLSIISPLFFPSSSDAASVSLGMISFAFSLCIGPVGALFWGKYGDRVGRLPMLKQSIMMMALPSLAIALLPTHKDIGYLAPILLTLCRFAQTFSASGEINGAKIFAMEHLGVANRGKVSGLISMAGGMGVLLAMAMGALLSKYGWSWRIPFFIGSSLAIVGIMIRRKVAESPDFAELLQKRHSEELESTGTVSMLNSNRAQAIIVIALAAMLGVLSYTMHGFLNPFLKTLGYPAEFAYQMGIVGLIACGIFSIITGLLIDKTKNAAKIMTYNLLGCIVLTPIAFLMLLNANNMGLPSLIYISYILLGALLGVNATASSVIMYQLFSPQNRCRGVMICYSIGMSVFGGLTPVTLTLSTKYGNFFPAILIIIIALIVSLFFNNNQKKVNHALY